MTSSPLADARLVLAWGTVRAAAFPDRVAAAAAAGIPSIGLMIGDYLALRKAGWTDEELLDVLQQHDVTIDEVEVLFGFAGPSGPANIPERPGLVYADAEAELAAFHMGDVFGVRNVQTTGRFASPPTRSGTTDAFSSLCDRAAEHGMAVALEFVPYTDIPDLAAAAQIVADAGRPNGGLCVDSWHFFRGSADFDALEAVDPAIIRMIQINDGPVVPVDSNRAVDSVHHRRCPGEGEFDLARWLAAMNRPGLAASVSVEVYSDELTRMSSAAAAQRAGAATRDVIQRVIGGPRHAPVGTV
ncbi:sugar phosphate isomerase/epimerase [Geodermatophilus sabuli]|uniref:Sugar phosphate isomerase/epimerase n=1 Tax=Geodermatophilus sabuli TaxID=1564158 RepID=A0A7K3VX03_9ACTN|nr:sugar phosphate isomerase/epimerase [Geodermatophilus sabuli]NEK56868.1 sugar phosphate isomerase/epimerase [Geodermatophilus sabuli]